ncbi:MMPL family transporter [Actinoplanes aureus]|uniref:MMPL family transporter n=1 Tax=Actinoplanes aureus TaxID=2792083 RepID=A0A931CBK5_9ACTN|nr:MMPL family transporter [Actinoplanes aureus]MBG0564351.1 MMPL family transporter [Actinoplanes aureus]
MAEFLYRLGRWCARRAWTVLASWIVILGLSVTGYLAAGGTLSSQVTIPGTETAKVTDKLADRLPSVAGGNGTLVFHTSDGSAFTAAQRTAIAALLTTTGELDGVAATRDPFATQQQVDEQTAQVAEGRRQVEAGLEQLDAGQRQLNGARALGVQGLEEQQATLNEQRAELEPQRRQLERSQQVLTMSSKIRTVSEDGTAAVAPVVFTEAQMDVTPETKEGVVDHVRAGLPTGVEVEFSNEITQSVPEILGVGEIAGLVVAAITLLVMLGTAIAAALPIISALAGVGIGVTASLSLSGVVDMLSITPVLGVMLGLAVGIDYCLFILNRHRRQLLEGAGFHESIGLANGTSGNAVVFAGATVLVALLALNVTGVPFLGLMGTVGAICVAVAVLIAITLTPALLALIGPRVLNRRARKPSAAPTEPIGTGRAVLTVIAGLAVLVVVALPALSMRLGLPDGSSEAQDSTQYRAYQLIQEKFGAGVNGPLLVTAELPAPAVGDDLLAAQAEIGTVLLAQQNVTAVAPVGQSGDNTLLAFQVIPDDGPSSSSTEQLVRDLRSISPLPGDVALGVAGSASGNIDISAKLADALPGYLSVVVGLSMVIMVFVFRSILVPVTATLGFILSLFATFGGLTAIFQWGWLGEIFGVHDPNPVLSFLPTILIGILFGLAMDYQLFLVSGMREAYAHGAPARVAVRQGVHAGRTVVIAAAIIMISVFGGFIFSNSAIITSLGFGLSFGVLVDAFLVRMLLIPAVMHLLGDSAWWIPKWLDRVLPDVDVEGAALERRHSAATEGVEQAQQQVDGAPAQLAAGEDRRGA